MHLFRQSTNSHSVSAHRANVIDVIFFNRLLHQTFIPNMSRLLLILFALIFSCCVAFSQNESIRPQNVKIASPNAAALGKVADVPIGYHTGTPNIDIPIYTVQEGPIQVPISIAYHASGLKVMEQASWVGAGWSLNAGGMITRSVRGMPDEILSSSGSLTPISYLNDKGYFSYLFSEGAGYDYDPQILPNGPGGQEQGQASYEFAQGRRDGEADMFNFNFNGYSGKFYFRPENTVVIMPQQDIRVTPLYCGSGNSNCSQTNEYLYGWIVTTPDGMKYYFGKDLTATYSSTNAIPLEYTTSYSSTSGLSYTRTASSWFLYKIESSDKKYSVSLEYNQEEYAYYTISSTPNVATVNSTGDLVKNIMKGVRLTAIKFSNSGVVSFIPSFVRKDVSGPNTNLNDIDPDSLNATAPRRLGEIRISNSPTTTHCQSFVFDYAYFYDTRTLTGWMSNFEGQFSLHSDKRRLKLKAFTEKNCDGSINKPPHKFSYFDEASVPRTLSFAQDHWGFYNGEVNASMVPAISNDNGQTNVSGIFGNRNSKWPEMRAGSLEKIQYPLGGKSRFVFESHNVYIPVNIYDSTFIGQLSANYTQTSGSIAFSLSLPTTMKARISFPYYPSGQGNIHIINTVTNTDYGPLASQGLKIFTLPAGNYQFSIQSTSNTYHPIECILYKINPGYQQLQSVTVGGLRLDSLIYTDGTNNIAKVQTYDYVDENGVDQGVLFSRPAYVAMIKNYNIKEHGGIPGGLDYQTSSYSSVNGCIGSIGEPYSPTDFLFYVSANAILPMSTSQGNHFGYNYVKVTESNGGYTAYKFKPSGNPSSDVAIRVINHKDCNDFLPNFPPAPEPFKPDRGELMSKSIFNSSNVLLYKETYTTDYQYEPVGVRGLVAKSVIQIILTTQYEWKNAKKTKSTVKAYTYDVTNAGGTPVYKKTETFFESSRHAQPTRIVVSDGDGKVLSEVKKTYVADLIVPACPDLEAGLNTIDVNLNAAVASQRSTYDPNVCASYDSPCKLERYLLYNYYANLERKASVQSRITLINSYTGCMTGTTGAWSWSASSPELKAIVKLKNKNQLNAVVEQSQWRDGMLLSSESISYKDFENDTVSYFPDKLSTIQTASTLPANNFNPIALTATGVTRDSKYVDEETYSFKTGNIAEVLGASGVKTSYLWGYNNSQPIAQAIHASQNQIYHNSFEVSGGTAGNSKTGSKYYDGGVYIVPFTPPADGAVYKMSYWYWSNSKWNFSGELAFNQNINSGGTRLDEIRVYPQGAQLATYTYDMLVGMTSQTDANNFTSYFLYDQLGRLQFIKDDQGNVVKKMEYNYKN
jgi:hypothetical protein